MSEVRDLDRYERFYLKFFGSFGYALFRSWRFLPEKLRERVIAYSALLIMSATPLYLLRDKIYRASHLDQIPTLVQNQNHMARGLARVPVIAQAFQAVDSEDLARRTYDSIAAAKQRTILGENRQTPAQVSGNYIWALTLGVVP